MRKDIEGKMALHFVVGKTIHTDKEEICSLDGAK
jgi:hypothetical protein